MAGIYIHIPFCVRKCLYCDFVSGEGTVKDMEMYVDSLVNEINNTYIEECIDSVFVFFFTLYILSGKLLVMIFDTLNNKFDFDRNCEITIEANPGTIDENKLESYLKCGINRLSIGLQSADDKELAKLGRIHNYEQFLESYSLAKNKGFTNINIDLMSALPGQTIESYKDTIDKVLGLNPAHISAYSLIIEEGTFFYDKYNIDNEKLPAEERLPSEETEREMYYYTKEALAKKGYFRYEISNYSKPGFECRHNLKYWNRENYYGFGVCAASFVNNRRYRNISDTKKYISLKGNPDEVREEVTHLTQKEAMEEFMFLGLRKINGVSKEKFKNEFAKDISEVYGNVIEKYKKINLIDENDEYILLTDKGIDVSNIVMSEFLLD